MLIAFIIGDYAIVFLSITSIVFLLQTEAACWKYNREDSFWLSCCLWWQDG